MTLSTKERLENMASGFMAARVLLTGVELDVFTRIGQGALRAHEIARKTRTQTEPMERLLNALAGLGILKKQKGRFRNTRAALIHLTKNAPEPLWGIMQHRCSLWLSWSQLTQVVRTGKVPPRKKTSKQEESFIRGMADIGILSARETAKVLRKELKSANSLLDVGGGPAVYACELVKHNPGLKVTVLDLPGPLKIARETIRHRGMKDRVKVKAGDILKLRTYGEGYDLVFMSNLIHSFKRSIAQEVVKKAAQAVKPGGHLVIKEFYIRNDGTAPTFSALFSINMLVADAGDCFTRSEVENWMSTSGVKPMAYTEVMAASGILKGIKK